MQTKFEMDKIEDDVVYGRVTHPGGNLQKIAYDFLEKPPSMPCQENTCPVETRADPGSWMLALRIKKSEDLEAIRSGRAEIVAKMDGNGVVSFGVIATAIKKANVASEPGVCDYCRKQIAAGKLPPYHENCKCKVTKGVMKMTVNSELQRLNLELEELGKSFVSKSARALSKTERAVAITKASQTPQGAKIARQIMALQQLQASGVGEVPDNVVVRKAVDNQRPEELSKLYAELEEIGKNFINKDVRALSKEEYVTMITKSSMTPAGAIIARRIIALEHLQNWKGLEHVLGF